VTGYLGFFDGSGFPVGTVLPTAAVGFAGIFDWTGMTVGAEVEVLEPTVGFAGFFDWTGLPVGLVVEVLPPAVGFDGSGFPVGMPLFSGPGQGTGPTRPVIVKPIRQVIAEAIAAAFDR
jgi:hypothetical protein